MTWIVVGASSGLGRALSEQLARDGKDILLIARDERDLLPLTQDLSGRFGVKADYRAIDASNLTSLRLSLDSVNAEGILFPIGVSDESDRASAIPEHAAELIGTNFISVVEVVRLFLPSMLGRRDGVIIGFGSVAATRGRTSNAVYAASKAALRSFFESLRHACDGTGVLVQFYVLGYLDTNLSFGRKLLFPKAHPSTVAERVVRNIGRGGGIWYLPSFWKWIAVAVRLLPWPIFRRLNF